MDRAPTERPARKLALRDPLHGEFLALLGAVEEIKIDQLLVRSGVWATDDLKGIGANW